MFIRIVGEAGEGKNTLAVLLSKFLVENGFKDVAFIDYEGCNPRVQVEHLKNKKWMKEFKNKRIVLDTLNIKGKPDFLPNPLDQLPPSITTMNILWENG